MSSLELIQSYWSQKKTKMAAMVAVFDMGSGAKSIDFLHFTDMHIKFEDYRCSHFQIIAV